MFSSTLIRFSSLKHLFDLKSRLVTRATGVNVLSIRMVEILIYILLDHICIANTQHDNVNKYWPHMTASKRPAGIIKFQIDHLINIFFLGRLNQLWIYID